MRKTTTRTVLIVSKLALIAVLSLGGPALASDEPGAARSDSEIQQCIVDRLAASPALKDQGLTSAVSNGVATLSGMARNPGSKGNATRIAKKCGATTVNNNITISPSFKPAKKPASDRSL